MAETEKQKAALRKMCDPRRAGKGWYYINRNTIDVYTPAGSDGHTKLTRRQLEQALKLMDAARP